MPSWNDGETSSDDDCEAVSMDMGLMPPATIFCSDWSGLATDLPARCLHRAVCETFVAFESMDSGRRFLGCAQKEGPRCPFVQWVDPEWPATLKMSLARIWGMFDDENSLRLRQNVVNAEENFRILKEKERMEKDLRFFKVDFAKMVGDKEKALNQLGNAQIALSDLKQELEKKILCDKSVTNIHQVLRAKAEREMDLMKQEMDSFMHEKKKLLEDRDSLMLQRDQLKKEKKQLEYTIADMFKHQEERKEKIRQLKEILDEF